jgi:hypothetical protein
LSVVGMIYMPFILCRTGEMVDLEVIDKVVEETLVAAMGFLENK